MQGEQPSNNPNALPQAIRGMLGNNQGSGQTDQLIGMLEQMIAGDGQVGAQNMNMVANGTTLNMVQSIAEQLSHRTGFPPQTAQTVVSLVLHRMLTSHSAFGNNARLNLQDVLQQMRATGGIDPDILHNSGMVNGLVNASGLERQAALQHLYAYVPRCTLRGRPKLIVG